MRGLVVLGAAMGLLAFGGAALGQSIVQPARWAIGPKDEDIDAAWPAEARSKGIPGEASIECVISEKAQIHDCKAIAEKPAGGGFGEAALGLMPRFKAVPARLADRPVESITRFVVRFPADQPVAGLTVNGVSIQLPDSVKEPTPDELFAAWPQTARANSVEGDAELTCVVNPYGELTDCKVTDESKKGLGFGAAALALSNKFQYLPGLRDGMSVSMRMPIDVQFRCTTKCTAFTPPESFSGQLVSVPWQETPSVADIQAAYPKAALESHTQGSVTLFCQMRNDGGVTGCKATSEQPGGMGFGAAAIALSSRFKGPARRAGEKSFSGAGVQIPIGFSSKGGIPSMVKSPSGEEFTKAFPKEAAAAQVAEAKVMLRCKIVELGALQDCVAENEEPTNLGFGAAAISLVPSFAMSRWSENGRPTAGSSVRIPLRFVFKEPDQPKLAADGGTGPMVITKPDWIHKPSGEDVSRFYPPMALRLERNGGALVSCTVVVDGSLRDCVVSSESPLNMGFGKAALAMAPLFKMRPVQVDGHSIEGSMVQIPVDFTLH